MSYWDRLCAAKESLFTELTRRGVEPRYLDFGGPGQKPSRTPTVPTDARSEFLANRAMGDWAENLLAAAVRQARPDWRVCKYGSSEKLAAGDPGFKEFYLGALEKVRLYGKQPDLLVFPAHVSVPETLSEFPIEESDPWVAHALVGIEVRSSKVGALRYMAVRREQQAQGSRRVRESPSFTVKVEDLKIVYRWIERYRKPQVYAQVFFDSVFALNFLDAACIIGSGEGFVIEKPKKSQEKSTIMIPITCGTQIGRFTELPTFQVAQRITNLGRHDAYVAPTGGRLELDPGLLEKVLLG